MESKPIVLEGGKLRQSTKTEALGFYTTFCCGNLSDLDPSCFNAIDCGEIDLTSIRKTIDLGVLE